MAARSSTSRILRSNLDALERQVRRIDTGALLAPEEKRELHRIRERIQQLRELLITEPV